MRTETAKDLNATKGTLSQKLDLNANKKARGPMALT